MFAAASIVLVLMVLLFAWLTTGGSGPRGTQAMAVLIVMASAAITVVAGVLALVVGDPSGTPRTVLTIVVLVAAAIEILPFFIAQVLGQFGPRNRGSAHIASLDREGDGHGQSSE